jgi:hypothetical protein
VVTPVTTAATIGELRCKTHEGSGKLPADYQNAGTLSPAPVNLLLFFN